MRTALVMCAALSLSACQPASEYDSRRAANEIINREMMAVRACPVPDRYVFRDKTGGLWFGYGNPAIERRRIPDGVSAQEFC